MKILIPKFVVGLLISFALFVHLNGQIPSSKGEKTRLNSFYDGPYVFYQGSVMKIFTFSQNDSSKKVKYDEQTFNLKDTVDVLKKLHVLFGFNFNPYHLYSKDSSEFKASKICVVSDIHGRYDNLVTLLKNNNVVDKNLNWNFGNGHLVVLGDIISKGPKVTDCLWLVKKLETQASEAKGKVHYLLGNHEAFLLKGVYTDVDPKYTEVCKKLGLLYHQLFGRDTEFGRWIATRSTMIKINGTLFVHGGISGKIVEKKISIPEINNYVWEVFNNEHLLFLNKQVKENCVLIFGGCGPLLYRGYIVHKNNSCDKDSVTTANVDAILKTYNCNRIVVGHTEVDKISPMYDDKIIPVNTLFPFDDTVSSPSNAQMLFIDDKDFYILYSDRTKEKITLAPAKLSAK